MLEVRTLGKSHQIKPEHKNVGRSDSKTGKGEDRKMREVDGFPKRVDQRQCFALLIGEPPYVADTAVLWKNFASGLLVRSQKPGKLDLSTGGGFRNGTNVHSHRNEKKAHG